ncbi:MAG: hypothetical protein HRF40_11445 [Nitrososphaera sp.]|jgi:hypothetical protein
MNSAPKAGLPDIVVTSCLKGCGNCAGVYVNELTGHRIVCSCEKCDHQAPTINGKEEWVD